MIIKKLISFVLMILIVSVVSFYGVCAETDNEVQENEIVSVSENIIDYEDIAESEEYETTDVETEISTELADAETEATTEFIDAETITELTDEATETTTELTDETTETVTLHEIETEEVSLADKESDSIGVTLQSDSEAENISENNDLEYAKNEIAMNSLTGYAGEADYKLNGNGGEVKIGKPVRNDDNTFSCSVELPDGSTYVTVSVTNGNLILPLKSYELSQYGLELSYGVNTDTDTLIKSHNPDNVYGILTLKVTDSTVAGNVLSLIKYTKASGVTEIKISTTTTTFDEDTYIFYGHIYQVKTESKSSWAQAVVDAHNTEIAADDGSAERGYMATITSVNENKMLLNMIEDNYGNYTRTWIGGTSNYQDTDCTIPMDYDYLYEMVTNGVSESSYFTDDTMKKSTPDGHNGLKGEDFYWIDGPERGETLPDGGDYWCDSNHNQWNDNEPNNGHVIWVGYGGPYWDDIKLNQDNQDKPTNYIVEFGGKINPASGETTPISDAEAYSKISVEEITVTFNDNKTTPNSETTTVYSGDFVTLPSADRTGYELLGWSESPNGTSFVGNNENEYMPLSNVTLYAQWKPLISFESVTDSGVYDINNESESNADKGVVSFNFRLVDDTNDVQDLINNIFEDFFIRVNNKIDIISENSTKPIYDDYNNNIQTEDNEGYWMHCIIDNIPEDSYNTSISAVPYARTYDGEIVVGNTVSENVNSEKWVLKDW